MPETSIASVELEHWSTIHIRGTSDQPTCIVETKYKDEVFVFLSEVPIKAAQQGIHDTLTLKIL